MLKNYFKTALRNIQKNKIFTLINILSLSLGTTCCFTLSAIYQHEYGFDQFHENAENIYRIVWHESTENGIIKRGVIPNPMGKSLEEELENSAEVIPMMGPLSLKVSVKTGNEVRAFDQSYVVYTNSSFLSNLNFPLLSGGPISMLDLPGNVFITQEMAQKYFGTLDPLGQILTFRDSVNFTVTGILENPPSTTNVPFEILVSHQNREDLYGDWLSDWDNSWKASAYVVANAGTSLDALKTKINQHYEQHVKADVAEKSRFHLQPLADVHTNDDYMQSVNYVPPTAALVGSGLVVILLLIVSILNYINLSTSQAIRRSREVGIRKTLGGTKNQLVSQFLIETFLLVSVAALVGLTLGQILINQLNQAVGQMAFQLAYDSSTVLFSLVLVLVVTILSGIYPSVVLARYSPISTLRNQMSLSAGAGSFSLRKVMIGAQFFIASFLIICTIVYTFQMQYIHGKDLGFDASGVTILPMSTTFENINIARTELANLSFVKAITVASKPPQSMGHATFSFALKGQPILEDNYALFKAVDKDYLDFYEVKLLAGTNLRNKQIDDSRNDILVNEELLRRLDLTKEQALGTRIDINSGFEGKIIGIVEDFHAHKLNRGYLPVIMAYRPQDMDQIHIRSHDGDTHFAELEGVFRKVLPTGIFSASLLSDDIKRSYTFENIIYVTVLLFSGIAIFVSLLGLYGLVTFMLNLNQKNLSIRKVFGASSKLLLREITFDYLKIIIVGFGVAVPVSVLVMNMWLDSFYYRIDLSPIHFLVALAIVSLVALITVGYKSMQAANRNPIEALRND